jgi:hypothetical protein
LHSPNWRTLSLSLTHTLSHCVAAAALPKARQRPTSSRPAHLAATPPCPPPHPSSHCAAATRRAHAIMPQHCPRPMPPLRRPSPPASSQSRAHPRCASCSLRRRPTVVEAPTSRCEPLVLHMNSLCSACCLVT